MRRISAILLSVACLMIILGCERRKPQHVLEARFVIGITTMLRLYDIADSGVTNLSQIFAIAGQGYPYEWHDRFKRFGKHAGFTNSIYEKYIFFAPGITNRWLGGELFFMNAHPFPGPDGLQREVILRGPGTYYGRRDLPERVIQRIFNEIHIAVPTMTVMAPPLPPPPGSKEEESRLSFSERRYHFFATCAQLLGMSHTRGWLIELAAGSIIAIAIVLGWLCFRRRLSRGNPISKR